MSGTRASEGRRAKSLEDLNLDERYKRAIRRAAAIIKEVLGDNLVELLLYGSVARGEPREFSDIDIAAIVREPVSWDVRWKMVERLHELELDEETVVMVAYVPVERYRRDVPLGYGWLYEVERDGVRL